MKKILFSLFFLFISVYIYSQIDTIGLQINEDRYFYELIDGVYGLALPSNVKKDTLTKYFAETFDGWSNNSVQTLDSLIKRWPIYTEWTYPERLSIVNFTPSDDITKVGNTEVFTSITSTAYRRAQQITMPVNGKITSISMYHGGGTGRAIFGVYDDLDGKPGNMLAMTDFFVIRTTAGWETRQLAGESLNLTGNQKVWLSWVYENTPGIRYVTGTPGRAESTAIFPSLTNPFGTSTIGTAIYSIYANIIPDGNSNGNMLRSTIPIDKWGSLQMDIMMGDTVSELWFAADHMADTLYSVKNANGYNAGRGIGGFFMGNTKDTTDADFSGWVHSINGPPITDWPLDPEPNRIATEKLMSYVYDRNGAYKIGPSIYSVSTPIQNLLVNWKFNEGGKDEIGSIPLNLTSSSIISTNDPAEGSGYANFNNSAYSASAYLHIPDEFSIVFWFRDYNDNATHRCLFGNGHSYYPDGYVLAVDEVDHYIKFATGDGVSRNHIFSNNGSWLDDKWNHVVITASKITGAGDIYVNGVKSTRSSSTGVFKNFNSGNILYLGKSSDNSLAWSGLDDFRLYNEILSAEDANTLYKKQEIQASSSSTTNETVWPTGRMYVPSGKIVNWVRRVRINDIGKNNGFVEVYEDGHLRVQMLGLNFRSVEQGANYGKIEGIHIMHFLGGPPNTDFSSSKTQSMYFDNLIAYSYEKGSKFYNMGPNEAIRDEKGNLIDGKTVVPIIRPTKSIKPRTLLYNENFTNLSDTIYDTGNPYIYNPPFKKEAIVKTISIPTGPVNYSFITSEFGNLSNDATCNMWVKVYSGIGASKSLVQTFSLDNIPNGNYVINNNKVTIEIYSGCNSGYKRGVAIKYWK